MARRKIGWKMRLRRKLRQDRAEQKIRARQAVKQAKQLNKIYGDLSPEEVDEINKISPQVAQAETQLQNDGYDTNGDPVQTMAQYNDVYGDGNGDLQDDVQQAFDESVECLDEDRADAYLNLAGEVGNLAGMFAETVRENNGGNLETFAAENAEGLFKKWIDKIKKHAEVEKNAKEEKRDAKYLTEAEKKQLRNENIQKAALVVALIALAVMLFKD